MQGLSVLEKIGGEFYGKSYRLFPSLEELKFLDMPKWRKWSDIEEYQDSETLPFPHLRKVQIKNCKVLSDMPVCCLKASLEELELSGCNEIFASNPSCLEGLKSLMRLKIHHCLGRICLPSQLLASLEVLNLHGCEVYFQGGSEQIIKLRRILTNDCHELDLDELKADRKEQLVLKCYFLKVFITSHHALSTTGILKHLQFPKTSWSNTNPARIKDSVNTSLAYVSRSNSSIQANICGATIHMFQKQEVLTSLERRTLTRRSHQKHKHRHVSSDMDSRKLKDQKRKSLISMAGYHAISFSKSKINDSILHFTPCPTSLSLVPHQIQLKPPVPTIEMPPTVSPAATTSPADSFNFPSARTLPQAFLALPEALADFDTMDFDANSTELPKEETDGSGEASHENHIIFRGHS